MSDDEERIRKIPVVYPHNNRVVFAFVSEVSEKPTCADQHDWPLLPGLKLYFVHQFTETITQAQARRLSRQPFHRLVYAIINGMYWVLREDTEVKSVAVESEPMHVTANTVDTNVNISMVEPASA